ncbi:HlyD domain containing protein [Laribacter hongkongensis HLHK9]|uniref:HlyD domain containing protein n=1 Tax=Laribacter hongkongensis (strain HLHK9) TaxID=557598 RepID=C1D9D6_LARHH|nr:HlyD domain containing protein [Laribacter hongkongensis HLHK9]
MLLARIRPGRKGWIALGLLLAAMLALWAWQPWAGPRTGVVRLAEHPLTHTVVATGYVSNTEESVLGATLTARVASLPVEEGQSVRAGDVLIRLESAEAAAAVEQARGNARQADATLAEARRQFRRQQQLFAQGFISQAALDAEDKKVRLAAALADTAHAAVTQAGAHLDEFTVRAPADGRLGVPAGRSRGSRHGRQAGADFCPPGPGRGAAGRGRALSGTAGRRAAGGGGAGRLSGPAVPDAHRPDCTAGGP